jgi:uncharacterized membrane protein YcaP (DUF421 family)
MAADFLDSLKDFFETVLGTEAKDLKFWQTMLRALIIYIIGLIIIRIGKKRLFSRNTAFDVILGIIIGSVLSRAINGNAPFLGTLTAGLLLVLIHWAFAAISLRSRSFGKLIKGKEDVLIQDGEVKWDVVQQHDLSKNDLKESMRLNASTEDFSQIQLATIERNGNISFLKKDKQLKVIEIEVKEGVQKIRIEINS